MLPVMLGSGRRFPCGNPTSTDFTHFDFPTLSAASEAKLLLWVAAHRPFSLAPPSPSPRALRSLVSNRECEDEMDTVLTLGAGAAGHAAFSRFRAGTGGTEVLGAGSILGGLALRAPAFLSTVGTVKAAIEAQLAKQATTGILDPCALSIVPAPTHFTFSDPHQLKVVIGGTQGERLFLMRFGGSVASRRYSATLRFLICDNFGVDEHDLYAPGLMAFWVLQHERSASLYAPFVNELDLTVSVAGRF